ncbi:MAG: ABC transporter permease [Methanomassiliicoccales archaeon]|nr:ABC transporter permease [Methanomassiliicoccales archaeon]
MSLGSQTHAPGDLQQVAIVTRYELHKHIRSRRIVGILAVEVLVMALILLVPPLTGNPYRNDPAGFIATFTSFTSILIIVGAILFAGDAIVSEFQGRTGYLILPNPVKRTSFFAGKVLASMIVMFAVITLYYLVAIVSAIGITGGTTVLSLYSYGLALLYGAAAIGIGYMISALMKGATAALVLTFAVLLLIFPVVTQVSAFAGAKPAWSLSFAGETITDIMQTPYPHDYVQNMTIPGGQNLTLHVYAPDVPTSIAVMLVYAGITLVVALILFRRKELLG